MPVSSFFAGLFRQLTTVTRRAANKQNPPKRQGPLRVEQLEPRHQCAVEVTQEFNFIVIDGEPDAGSLDIKHEQSARAYDDKIVVSWTTAGERQAKSFELYRYVERNGQRWAVKNIEYVELSSGRGKNRFWSQAKISSYLNTGSKLPQLHAAVYGDEAESLWPEANPLASSS
jgi:hypothetical protein